MSLREVRAFRTAMIKRASMRKLQAGLIGGMVFSTCLAGTAPADAERFDARRTYENLCASCHGMKGQGGTAPSMLGRDALKHPTADGMFGIIKDGNDLGGMPGYGEALSDPEIRALVIYIRELRERHARAEAPTPEPDSAGVYESQHHRFRSEVVADGLATPWSMAVLPDGRFLVCEKRGTLRLVNTDGSVHAEPITGTPAVFTQNQGGLLEVALHPGYETPGNAWVYLGFSDIKRRGGRDVSMTKIVRGRIDFARHRWVDEEMIYEAEARHYMPTRHHFGVRLVFDDGYVYFPIGDRGRQDMAQDLTVPNGKFHRVHDDGRIPTDNPFVGHPQHPDALPTIWTYGNRNPQGAAQHPATGALWSTEHGPRGGDELNVIEPGVNYGWPVITYGMNYTGTPITEKTAAPGMAQPVHHWTPSIAVCGIEFVTGDAFPNWENDLLVTGLAKQTVRRLRLDGNTLIEEEEIIRDRGRVRDVHLGPRGEVYVVFNQPDQIVRLTPVD